MSLTGKWIDLIYRAATGSWKTRLLVAPFAGVVFLSLIAAFILLSLSMDHYLHFPKAFAYPWSLAAGICLITLGLFLMLISIACFARAKGTPVPFSPPPRLIKTGPYRYVRNPMLTGVFLQLFGLGTALGSLSLLFIFTPLFIIFNVWELKNIEEPELAKRLGHEYGEYRKQVPMFFPFRMKK